MESKGTLEMPMGMAMTMAQSPAAMEAFCRLSQKEQADIISKARAVKSRDEMAHLVHGLAQKQS